MTPYYDDGRVTIYHGDCREILPSLQADAVITDPPYGTTDGRAKLRGTSGKDFVTFGHDWDRDLPTEWVALAACGLSNGGAMIVWTNNLSVHTIWQAMEAAGMNALNTIYWRKTNPSPNPRKNFASAVESAVFGRKPGRVRSWNGGAFVANCWAESKPGGLIREHPTQKPIDLFGWLVSTVSNSADMVLDPFMGSGTTLVAAKNLGRLAIGIEIEERYCEIAARRCAQEVLDLGAA